MGRWCPPGSRLLSPHAKRTLSPGLSDLSTIRARMCWGCAMGAASCLPLLLSCPSCTVHSVHI